MNVIFCVIEKEKASLIFIKLRTYINVEYVVWINERIYNINCLILYSWKNRKRQTTEIVALRTNLLLIMRKALLDRSNFKSRKGRRLFFRPLHVMAKFSNELIASRHKLASWNVRTSNLLLYLLCTIDESWHLLANNIAIHSRWLSKKNDGSVVAVLRLSSIFYSTSVILYMIDYLYAICNRI